MLLSQIVDTQGNCAVVVRNGSEAGVLKGVSSTYQLVMDAIRRGQSLAERIRAHELGPAVDLDKLAEDGRLLLPLRRPDPRTARTPSEPRTRAASSPSRGGAPSAPP